jgi:hypothetical protein
LATSKNSIIELNQKTKMKTLPTPLCASKIILAFASIAIFMLRYFKSGCEENKNECHNGEKCINKCRRAFLCGIIFIGDSLPLESSNR